MLIYEKLEMSGKEVALYLTKQTRITSENIAKNGDITTALHLTYTTCANCGDSVDAWMISIKIKT